MQSHVTAACCSMWCCRASRTRRTATSASAYGKLSTANARLHLQDFLAFGLIICLSHLISCYLGATTSPGELRSAISLQLLWACKSCCIVARLDLPYLIVYLSAKLDHALAGAPRRWGTSRRCARTRSGGGTPRAGAPAAWASAPAAHACASRTRASSTQRPSTRLRNMRATCCATWAPCSLTSTPTRSQRCKIPARPPYLSRHLLSTSIWAHFPE